MKIAVLISHNTAARFICQILKRLGHEVYIPLFCSIENNTLQYDSARHFRNINDTEVSNLLDAYDFYSLHNHIFDSERIGQTLIINFHLIITMHCIDHNLNIYLSRGNGRVYHVLWGDDNPFNPYHYVHENIMNNPTQYYLVTLPTMISKLGLPIEKCKQAKLGIDNIDRFSNIYTSTNVNSVVIIISRIHHPINEFNRKFIEDLADRLPNIEFHIVGKDNSFWFQKPNLHCHQTFNSTEELYYFIASKKAAINLLRSPYVLQYQSVEFGCINIPCFYAQGCSLYNIIGDSCFCYRNLEDLVQKINTLLVNNMISEFKYIYENINSVLYNSYKIDNLLGEWSLILQ